MVKRNSVLVTCGKERVKSAFFKKIHATECAEKDGLFVVKFLRSLSVNNNLSEIKIFFFCGYLLFLLIMVVVSRQYALIKLHNCF